MFCISASSISSTLNSYLITHQRELATARIVAIEAYEDKHGPPPPSLVALVPDVLPELPIDPLHGLPFGYRLISAMDDPFKRGYLLYSIGWDQTDDNGLMPSPDDFDNYVTVGGLSAAISNPTVSGYDFIYNTPYEYEDWLMEQAGLEDEVGQSSD